jgi:ribonuclease P protein component
MFKKSERLTRSEFSEYFKVGRRHHTPHVTIITHPLPARKVAVVVGKKVAKSAVRRNTLKRRVYALLRESLTVNDYRGVLIVILKPPVNSLPRQQLSEVVHTAIAQVIKST